MKLFTPVNIGSVELKNRLVMAPMITMSASEEGFITDNQQEYYLERARGGVGLIITEAAAVTDRAAGFNMLRIHDDRYISSLRRLTDKIHTEGAKIVMQIVHWMRVSRRTGYVETFKDLSTQEISEIIDAFVKAATRVREAGFDGVEFHAAHAYTLASSLSVAANKRTDAYGGSLENRMNMLTDILERSRDALGDGYPIGARINGDDFTVHGNTLLHTKPVARRLSDLGIDYLDVSAGGRPEESAEYSSARSVPGPNMPDGVNVYLAAELKEEVSIPVITAGKIRTPELAEDILVHGKTDLVALGRALLADAAFANKAQSGRSDTIWRCTCCNRCSGLMRGDVPLHCIARREKERADAEQ